ncbi:MAG: hypothetical protein KC478_04935 [Bacteriovoracaceae bacterium]|nr:hypothetical protein [Bacteriovoracaceae bacterium]
MRLNHLLFSLLFLVFASETAKAQTSTTTSSATTSNKNIFSSNNISASFTFGGRSDFKEVSSDEKEYNSEYELALALKLNAENSVSFYIPFEKELSGAYEARVSSDAKLSHTRSDLFQYKNMNVSFKSSVIYPTSETSKVQNEMVAGLEFGPTLSFDLNKYLTGLSFTYIPRYKRVFNKYTVDRSGDQLTNQSVLQFFVANYNFTERFSFQSAFIYVNSWRYDGAQNYDSYLTVQELSATLTDKVSVSFGVETSASLVNEERGESKSVQIFDKNFSEVYGKASVVF